MNLGFTDEPLYFYKIASLASPVRGEILACAGRQGGFAAMPLAGAGLETYGKKLRPIGVDFVDVAALGVSGFPFAAACLGLDCSIRMTRDLLNDNTLKHLHFSPAGERAYRLLCKEGHVFMLTDKSLYAFVDLATRFLQDDALDDPIEARRMDLEAVDISMTPDRSLLVVMPDSVYRIEIDSLIARDELRFDRRQRRYSARKGHQGSPDGPGC